MITIKSKIRDIKKVPAAVEIIDKHIPGFCESPDLVTAEAMSFKAICPYVPVDKEVRDAIEAEFQAAQLPEAE